MSDGPALAALADRLGRAYARALACLHAADRLAVRAAVRASLELQR